MKKKDFEKHLRKHGCILYEQGKKHEKYINLATNKKSVVPRHANLNPFTCRAICKQLEIPIIEGK